MRFVGADWHTTHFGPRSCFQLKVKDRSSMSTSYIVYSQLITNIQDPYTFSFRSKGCINVIYRNFQVQLIMFDVPSLPRPCAFNFINNGRGNSFSEKQASVFLRTLSHAPKRSVIFSFEDLLKLAAFFFNDKPNRGSIDRSIWKSVFAAIWGVREMSWDDIFFAANMKQLFGLAPVGGVKVFVGGIGGQPGVFRTHM